MTSALKVVFLSDWIVNPYKELLSAHLAKRGAEVHEFLWSTFFAGNVLKVGRVDVLHLHTLHPFLLGKSSLTRRIKLLIFIGQIALLRAMGTKTVWTVHEWADKLDTGKNNIPPKIAAIAVRFLHAVIVHCKTTQQELKQLFGLENERKIVVIPHGNYIELYENVVDRVQARDKLGLSEYSVVFLLFGNLYRYKGVLEAIAAFNQLANPQTSLIVAGKLEDAALKREIEAAIAGEPNILLVPERIADEDVQIYMNASDCALVPYTVYTTSGVAVLAMSFGKACIAPKVGFFCDVLEGEGGILYDLPHEEGLVRAMAQAVEERSQLSRRGQHNFERAENWNWDYVAGLTLEAYGHD